MLSLQSNGSGMHLIGTVAVPGFSNVVEVPAPPRRNSLM
jgi:hypothetical protein